MVARMKTGVFQIRVMTPPRSQSTGRQSVPQFQSRTEFRSDFRKVCYIFSNVRMASMTARPT
jgi:hypothetical protein